MPRLVSRIIGLLLSRYGSLLILIRIRSCLILGMFVLLFTRSLSKFGDSDDGFSRGGGADASDGRREAKFFTLVQL